MAKQSPPITEPVIKKPPITRRVIGGKFGDKQPPKQPPPPKPRK